MRIDVVTIFPEYLAPASLSLLGKAQSAGLISVQVHDLREHATDRHNTVDDTPYGGGPGMVMMAEPWGQALDAIADHAKTAGVRPRLVVPTPSGRVFNQAVASELAQVEHLVFACGRYEGIDSRVLIAAEADFDVDEISIGDYVLAGGEVAALVIIEATTRLVAGVLGNEESVADDSFAPGRMEKLVEGPVFTKPSQWRDLEVPDVVLSGDHAAIARWRRDEALRRTATRRPELIEHTPAEQFDTKDQEVLAALGWREDQGRWIR